MMEVDRAFIERINASRRQFVDGELSRLMKPAGEVLTLDGEGKRDGHEDERDERDSAQWFGGGSGI